MGFGVPEPAWHGRVYFGQYPEGSPGFTHEVKARDPSEAAERVLRSYDKFAGNYGLAYDMRPQPEGPQKVHCWVQVWEKNSPAQRHDFVVEQINVRFGYCLRRRTPPQTHAEAWEPFRLPRRAMTEEEMRLWRLLTDLRLTFLHAAATPEGGAELRLHLGPGPQREVMLLIEGDGSLVVLGDGDNISMGGYMLAADHTFGPIDAAGQLTARLERVREEDYSLPLPPDVA